MEISDLIFSTTASFYQVASGAAKQMDYKIKSVFKELIAQNDCSTDFEPFEVVQNSYDWTTATVSVLIFKRRKSPTFLKQSIEQIYEDSFVFFVLVEFDGFAALIKSQGLRSVNQAIDGWLIPLDYSTLARAFVHEDSLFEQIALENTDSSSNSLRSKTLQAKDVSKFQSPYQQFKYAVKNFRIRNEEETLAITFSTSRVNKTGGKVDIDEIVAWVVNIVPVLKNSPQKEKSLLDNSPQPVKWKDYKNLKLTPKSIIIWQNFFHERSLDDGFQILFKEQPISWKDFQHNLMTLFDHDLRLRAIPNSSKFKVLSQSNSPLEFDRYMKLVIMSRGGMKLESNALSKYDIKDSQGNVYSLLKWINGKEGSGAPKFLVDFKTGDFSFINGELFRIEFFETFSSSFIELLQPHKLLLSANSEKGKIRKHSDSFAEHSLFDFVHRHQFKEQEFEFMICDDLGNEWADFIGVKEDKITFFHCKFEPLSNPQKPGISASKFSDVFSQAQKNIGNVVAPFSEWGRKFANWERSPFFKLNHKATRISRLKSNSPKTDTLAKARAFLEEVMDNPNLHREVAVVVNFLSKQQVTNRIDKIRGSKNSYPHLKQLLWQSSQILSNMREWPNTEFKIYCVP